MTKAEALERAQNININPDFFEESCSAELLRVDREAERRGALAELRRMAREQCYRCNEGSPAVLYVGRWEHDDDPMHKWSVCEAQAEHRRIAEIEKSEARS